MVASIASVESQVRALAKSNSKLQQQLQQRLDIQNLPAESGGDSGEVDEKATEVWHNGRGKNACHLARLIFRTYYVGFSVLNNFSL